MNECDNTFLQINKNQHSYCLDTGFILHSETFELNFADAKKLLLSKKSRRITSATRLDNSILIKKHYYICPCCGNRIPAYKRYFFESTTNPKRYTKQEIEMFCDAQIKIINDNFDVTLDYNKIYKLSCDSECYHCRYNDNHGDKLRKRKCNIVHENGVLQIQVELDIKDLLNLKWLSSSKISVLNAKFIEVLQFDFLTGDIKVGVFSENNLILSKDISKLNFFETTDPCYELFNNINIKRRIKKAYQEITSYICPFFENQITINNTILITKFIGYNRSFYNGIPLFYGVNNYYQENLIDVSFCNISKKLHKASDVPSLYSKMSLPKCKSIKKEFMEKPELLFFHKELEKLWEVFYNVNHFNKFMKNENLYYWLKYVHIYEDVIEFFVMIKEVKGVIWLLKKLSKVNYEFSNIGIRFCSMNNSQKEFIKLSYINNTFDNTCRFSVPAQTLDKLIPDSCIDGFNFSWLRSSLEFYKASKELNNCLERYNCTEYPIIVIQRNSVCVGAIEIDKKTNSIIQASVKYNNEISTYPQLYEAYKKWCGKFNLEMEQSLYL